MTQSNLPALPHQAPPSLANQPPRPTPEQNPLLLLHRLLRGRYVWAVLLAILLGPLGGAIGYKALPSEYESTAIMRIAPVLPKVLFESEQNAMMPMFDSFMQTQVSLLQSRRIVEMAMQSPTWKEVGGEYSLVNIAKFMESLTVAQPKGSQLIQVTFNDHEPARARAAAKAVVDAYLSIYGETDLLTETQRFQLLEDRAKALKTEIDGLQAQIFEIANEFGSNALGDLHAFEVQELQKIQTELESAKRELATLESGQKVEAPSLLGKDLADLTVDEIALLDDRMRTLTEKRDEVRRQVENIARIHKQPERLPTYEATRIELESLESDIEKYAQFVRGNMVPIPAVTAQNPTSGPGAQIDPVLAQAKVERLQALYDDAKARTLALGQKNLKIESLRAEITRAQESLDTTNARIEQLNIESSVGGRISLMSEADTPTSPANARRQKQFAILGGMAGGGAGIGLILLVGFINPRIRDVTDAEAARPRLLGALPHLPEQVTDPAEAMVAAQCVHQIRTMLQTRNGSGPLSLTITGATSGTGKTSLALGLGLSFASAGARTLLIDGDVVGTGLSRRTNAFGKRKLGRLLRRYEIVSDDEARRAMDLSRELGIPIGQSLVRLGYISETDLEEGLAIQKDFGLGLADALRGERIEDCIADIGVRNLRVLPCFDVSPGPIDGMSPASVNALLDTLRKDYEVILVDTGPVPGQTESSVMAACTDGVVMVVSRGDNNPNVQQSLQHLQLINASVVGLVFNRAMPRDIERSGYSSSVSSDKRSANGGRTARIGHLPARFVRFGPLPYAVAWTSGESTGFAEQTANN